MLVMAKNQTKGEGEAEGILLYYKYAAIPDVSALACFFESRCRALGLLGRVRIAPDGINVTVGGKMSSLEKHIAEMSSNALFDGTDFKLASCDRPFDERIAKECGFTSFSVRIVKELVTLRSDPSLKSPEISNAGRHLSAIEFHSVLQDADLELLENALDSQDSVQSKTILLDARNLYETRIGKFKTPSVETLDPEIRQYSDLPAWIDENSELLHGKRVLMYCTGGIRCEMASAYIRSKGEGYENVFQLYGGIQRYLEQFPEGGYFKGKNFVFDHRISVKSQDGNILGACLQCGSAFDDYSSRCRCTYCRMLVLVCCSCQGKYCGGYICELCQKHGKGSKPLPLTEEGLFQPDLIPDSFESPPRELIPVNDSLTPVHDISSRCGNGHHRRLRILCLHGFRQNASNFKGRASSLAKKLKSVVEFVFVDAPHELPFVYSCSSKDSPSEQSTHLPKSFPQPPPPLGNCKKRFAWLVSSKSTVSEVPGWRMAAEPFDPLQYQQQTDGSEESYSYLQSVLSQMGPFDGILGFSQGAAMAALFCEKQQRSHGIPKFRFAILCSGFSAFLGDCSIGSIRCPSLHIFGSSHGQDRQIACQASEKLASLFDMECSVVIKHDLGHIIPTRSPYIDRMKEFLLRFL